MTYLLEAQERLTKTEDELTEESQQNIVAATELRSVFHRLDNHITSQTAPILQHLTGELDKFFKTLSDKDIDEILGKLKNAFFDMIPVVTALGVIFTRVAAGLIDVLGPIVKAHIWTHKKGAEGDVDVAQNQIEQIQSYLQKNPDLYPETVKQQQEELAKQQKALDEAKAAVKQDEDLVAGLDKISEGADAFEKTAEGLKKWMDEFAAKNKTQPGGNDTGVPPPPKADSMLAH